MNLIFVYNLSKMCEGVDFKQLNMKIFLPKKYMKILIYQKENIYYTFVFLYVINTFN